MAENTCSRCGKTSSFLQIFVDANTGQKTYLCNDCMFEMSYGKISEIEEIDKGIRETEELVKEANVMVDKANDRDNAMLKNVNKAAAAFMVTPWKLLKLSESQLAHLQEKRTEILMAMDPSDRLQYQMKVALKNEDYEEAERIKSELEKMNKNDST